MTEFKAFTLAEVERLRMAVDYRELDADEFERVFTSLRKLAEARPALTYVLSELEERADDCNELGLEASETTVRTYIKQISELAGEVGPNEK